MSDLNSNTNQPNTASEPIIRMGNDDALQSVAELRLQHPEKSADELSDILIRQRCLQTARVGAATAGVAAIPGVGAVASAAVGSMVDMDATRKIQALMIAEIAHIYRAALSDEEVLQLQVVTITGVDSDAEQLLSRGGKQLARSVAPRFLNKSVARAIPFFGMATSAGSNILMTYVIGQRTKSYIKDGPESVEDWETNIRAVIGMEEGKLTTWLNETMTTVVDSALEGFDRGAQKAGRAAGKATRKVVQLLQRTKK